MTYDQIVSPWDAPFSVAVIPTGLSAPLTVPQAAALNTAYPKPPYGFTTYNMTTGAAKP